MRLELRYDDSVPREMLQRAPDFFRRRLALALERGAQEIAREAKGRAPKAFSTLTNSIRAIRENDLHWHVAPGVNYGTWVEGGRMPMRKTGTRNGLLEWIKLKVAPGASGKELDRLGFVIARAIGRRGIKPQPFMAPAFEARKQRVVDMASRAMRDAVAQLNGGGHVA
jgi:hypothetical protein